MSLGSICSLLLLLASRASGIECGTSSGQTVAPSVVEDTAGAMQLAEALYCGGSFSVEWLTFVSLETTIIVHANSTLNVTGVKGGSSWVDGANQLQLFQVINGTLNLDGLNLIGGRTADGSAISASDSDVSVKSCSFVENNAASSGAAIISYRSNVRVDNCFFSGNKATLYGGAIAAFDSDIGLANCSFFQNNASSGGAIYFLSSTLVLGDSIFFGNSAEYSEGSTSYDTNITDFFGGAICACDSVVDVFNCSFFENIANSGGAVFFYFTNAMLGNATFFKNVAGHSGGAIYSSSCTSIIVNGNAVWEANESIFGGAIHLYDFSSLNILGNTEFSRNSADEGGGIWLSEGSSMSIFGSASFDKNTAIVGGAINLQDETSANFSGEVFMSGNTASSFGGAMHCQAVESISVNNTRFTSNFAGSSGGAISVTSAGPEDVLSKVLLCLFENNTAGDAGGALYTTGGLIEIYGSNFIGNIAGEASEIQNNRVFVFLDASSAYTSTTIRGKQGS